MISKTSLTPDEQHIASLCDNGARVKVPGGTTEPLTMGFYHRAVEQCVSNGYSAVTYNLNLPGVEDELALCVWADGRVDSGTMKSICDFLAAR